MLFINFNLIYILCLLHHVSCMYLYHLILYVCTIVCMRTPLKRSPEMLVLFSCAILDKYIILYYDYYYFGIRQDYKHVCRLERKSREFVFCACVLLANKNAGCDVYKGNVHSPWQTIENEAPRNHVGDKICQANVRSHDANKYVGTIILWMHYTVRCRNISHTWNGEIVCLCPSKRSIYGWRNTKLSPARQCQTVARLSKVCTAWRISIFQNRSFTNYISICCQCYSNFIDI